MQKLSTSLKENKWILIILLINCMVGFVFFWFYPERNFALLPAVVVSLISYEIYVVISYVTQEIFLKNQKLLKEKNDELLQPFNQLKYLNVDILSIHMGTGLMQYIDPDSNRKLIYKIGLLRKTFAQELGYIMPNVRVLDNLNLKDNEYSILLRGSVYFHATVLPSQSQEDVEKDIIYNLRKVCIDQVENILCLDIVAKYVEFVNEKYPMYVKDLVPAKISLVDLKEIFANIIKNEYSIRDILYIFEKLNYYTRFTTNPGELSEKILLSLKFLSRDKVK